ncbi:carboxypeptidase M32 [Beijerinckia indica]|uniref:Metal-dependent carboxypeptidase n=1 Tax=Beijerinckia indica subsp. indica (strain ATCC 9039 / DSM 1715 / NCIMB 8712) TaxID=395963 RepID=B2IF02_BEII9|nr:carboxypeptidase M32 [Beijerinckia indica]ACB94193.1 Carboxypeptidase Taq [Beijerinckia indica subsp. indica ATCC 9039]
MTSYHALEQQFARIDKIKDVIGLLNWDTETIMPDGAAEGRSEQLSTLEGMAHRLLVSAETGELLDKAEAAADGLDDWQSANLREMRRLYFHAAAIPEELVEANSKAVSRSLMAWRQARKNSDFAALLPYLKEVLDLQRRIGQIKGEALGLSPYDALLDTYEPGMRQAKIDLLFTNLRAELPSLIQEAQARQASLPPTEALTGPFPIDLQRGLGKKLMAAVGFDFERGRLDISLHPFCGGATDDVRITSRYDEERFISGLMGVLHETGHALYEQGRPEAWRHQPVGAARGMALHESQSLLIEMQACRSRAFVHYLAPLLRETFQGDGAAWSADNLYRDLTTVKPGFIRVDADEVTYPAHVLLRYDLEKAMINGDLRLEDLPGAFNEGMKTLLGLTVPNDGLGCLQDIHWPGGSWGYFPTYTLGAMAAAQLFDAASRAEPDVLPGIGRGDFGPLRSWLSAHVHRKGSLLEMDELLIAATGRPLGAEAFQKHLRTRYLEDRHQA